MHPCLCRVSAISSYLGILPTATTYSTNVGDTIAMLGDAQLKLSTSVNEVLQDGQSLKMAASGRFTRPLMSCSLCVHRVCHPETPGVLLTL